MMIWDAPLWVQIASAVFAVSIVFCALSLIFALNYFKKSVDEDNSS